MGKFNEYTQKTTPEDADSLMIYDAAAKANKLSPFSGIWNWIVGKLTNAVISNLQTRNQTVVGALNELNGSAFLPKAELRTSADSAEPGAYRVTAEHPVDGETEAILLCFKIFNNDWGLFTQFLIPKGGGYIKARTCWYKTWENWKKYNVGAIDELSSNTRFDVTVPDNVSIVNNASINVGRVVYLAVKLKITRALSSATVLSFSGNAANESTTFVIGKGTEWYIDGAIYGYLGGNSVAISMSSVSIGDYLHINTVLIL